VGEHALRAAGGWTASAPLAQHQHLLPGLDGIADGGSEQDSTGTADEPAVGKAGQAGTKRGPTFPGRPPVCC
jgi:hypothetical protein